MAVADGSTRTSRRGVEERWQRTWEDEGLYRAGAGARRDDTFVIAIPPPNVTGALHMGHALNGSIQDVAHPLAPHAGLRHALAARLRPRGDLDAERRGEGARARGDVAQGPRPRGVRRARLGRTSSAPAARSWASTAGWAPRWTTTRERFTMDDAYIEAVMRFFVHLWDRGWIYRANRIVNWCPFHETAISDLEVVHEDMDDTLTYARYPFADGSGHVTIATVRPATILADVAVAVHPDDERYRDAIGKEVVVPYVERAVPVIADERVDPEFGTGALKITPGHDPTDFEIGRDHGLPTLSVIGPDGRMNENAGDLAGKTQDEADEAILAWLKERGRLEKREHYRHAVGTCERCHTRIEPLVSLQWWVAMEEPRKPALEALRERRVRYHPESQHQFAIRSLEEIPDWNISRQLWWGHQLPIWYCPNGHVDVRLAAARGLRRVRLDRARARPGRARHVVLVGALAVRDARLAGADARAGALLPGRRQLDRARDHPALGEPDDLGRARGDGRRALPRRDHPLDDPRSDGRRMSKSLGTGIDPLDVIDALRRGRDALRAAQDVLDAGRALRARA